MTADSTTYGGPGVANLEGSQEAVDLINHFGGFSVIAHPIGAWEECRDLQRAKGMEIYSGYVSFKHYEGVDPYYAVDRNIDMEANWDRQLMKDNELIGIAVNDHFGPYAVSVPSRLRDTGKIVVIAHAPNIAEFRNAISRGAVFAVKDVGDIKNRYPVIRSITFTRDAIELDSDARIEWISNGKFLLEGRRLLLTSLPAGTTYVRAKAVQDDGSMAYTQAFSIRPVGDSNGDGKVDRRDDVVCRAVELGTDVVEDHRSACAKPE